MAIRTWNGTVNGNWGTTGNWDGGLPGATDVGMIPFDATVNIDAGLTAIAAMQELIVQKGCPILIGSSGSPIETRFTVGGIHYEGAGELHCKVTAGTTPRVIIAATHKDAIIVLGGSTITKLILLRGNVTLDTTLGAITLLEVGYRNDQANDVSLKIALTGSTISKVIQNGGTIINNAALISLLEKHAGRYRHISTSGVALTEANIFGGDTEYESSGGITDLRLSGGSFAVSGPAMTITNLFRYSGSRFSRTGNSTVHAITNEFDLRDES